MVLYFAYGDSRTSKKADAMCLSYSENAFFSGFLSTATTNVLNFNFDKF